MSVNSITSSSSSTSADLIAQLNGTTSASGKSSDLETPFLKVLTAQMKNQDPLNPTDNAELTSQLAQISTVDGVNKMNKSMATLSTLFTSNQTLQAASLLGHQVMAEGSSLSLSGGEALGGITLSGTADRVTVSILDANGAVVSNQELGKLDAGYTAFMWDGKAANGETLPEGDYTYSVNASNNGTSIDVTRYAMTAVASVVSGASGMKLQMMDGSRRDLSQIQAYF